MRTAAKIVIGLAIFIVIIILILGFTGLIRVPFVTSSPQSYYGGIEITDSVSTLFESIQQLSGTEQPMSLDTLQSYGLDVHFYGTDDSLSSVEGYYDAYMVDWSLDHDESGPGWTTKIWRNIAYGFGFMGGQHSLIKSSTGYNTIYMTVEGSATAWAPLLSQID